jgi:hypothetical protein
VIDTTFATSAPTTLELITLVVAIFGAITGAAAIAVQVGQFIVAGPRVRVSVLPGFYGVAGNLVGPAGGYPGGKNWSNRVEGFDVPAVIVEVRNIGRMPTDIETWDLEVGGGMRISLHNLPAHNAPLPYRLEAKAQRRWFVPLDTVRATVRASETVVGRETRFVVGRVILGDGRTVRSSRNASLPGAALTEQ